MYHSHAAPQGNWTSVSRASTPQGLFPDSLGWLLVTMGESAPELTGHHGSLSFLGYTTSFYSMQAIHSNSNIALRITMLCGNVTARHNEYKNDPLDFFPKYS